MARLWPQFEFTRINIELTILPKKIEDGNGECEAAFKFYEQCLGGKIVSMMTYADSPARGSVIRPSVD